MYDILQIIQSFVDLVFAAIAIFVTIWIAKWQNKMDLTNGFRPLLYAAIYKDMDLKCQKSKRSEFLRIIVETNEYIDILKKIQKGNSQLQEYTGYQFFRVTNNFNNDAINVNIVVEYCYDQKDLLDKKVIDYTCFRLNIDEELMILLPIDNDMSYKYDYIRANIKYSSIVGEKFTYEFKYGLEKKINHSYIGKYKRKITFKEEIQTDYFRRHVQDNRK